MTAYVVLDDYKTWADIKSPNQDAQINQILEAACDVVQEYIGFKLTIDGSGDATTPEKVFRYQFTHPYDHAVLLPDWNAEISEIKFFVKNGATAYTIPDITTDNYYVDDMAGVLHLTIPISTSLGIEVKYTYSNPLTESIKLATYMLIDYWRNKDFQMVKLQGGQSVTSTPTRVLPKHIESILNSSRGM